MGGGGGVLFYLFLRVLREAAKRGWDTPGGGVVVALMCLSWFAFLRVGEASSIWVADVRGEKVLGFCATDLGIIGRCWCRWSEWSGAWGAFLQGYTEGWEGDEKVVCGGPPVFEVGVAWARGPPEA